MISPRRDSSENDTAGVLACRCSIFRANGGRLRVSSLRICVDQHLPTVSWELPSLETPAISHFPS